MKNPTEVNPNNFQVKQILFTSEDDTFSIAYGIWHGEKNVLAMRWNGKPQDPKDVGYPKTFGNPMWFIVHDDLLQPIVHALANVDQQLIKRLLDSTKTPL